MEYTVQGLAKLAGVSTRALRYYDEIGILKPARI
ncbi:MAG TPA: MerR family transcriptional regulator, partial [Clostridiaceae bacterium]|nr:MerR family transcriptional regulator [Clostridiaceae bacterium]